MNELIDLNHPRVKQARLANRIGPTGYRILLSGGIVATVAAIGLGIVGGLRYGLILASPALFCYLPALWWKRQLSVLAPTDASLAGRLSGDVLSRLAPNQPQNPQTVWQALHNHWQANFLLNHLLLSEDVVVANLSVETADLGQALQFATQLAEQNNCPTIELGFVMAGLMLSSAGLRQSLVKLKLQPADIEAVANWLGRNVMPLRAIKGSAGGIGRDWAFGFTPLLDQFGHNVSSSIAAKGGAHFTWLARSEGVRAMEAAFNNHSAGIALIAPEGRGKTNSVYALAQRMLEGEAGPELAFHQIIALNATDITSNASQPGELEQLMIRLANEAAQAGHIVLFFDDAQLFFSEAPGAFDATQILLSIVQSRSAPMIFAMTPEDYQRLRTRNQSLAGQLTPVVLQELPEPGVMRVLEDTALGLESQNHILVAYEALHEAYRLSDRYEQDEAYPGKAIKLLKQAVAHSSNSLLNTVSVQQAVEQTRGVKVGTAAPAEADALLHLEDDIHKRMINQSHAVKVVAGALRRARAGVANPRRPIGSFLFLGPTGVGKTELTKAIAATYFGAETNMVRLDMSEYQQAEDVSRLLSNGQDDTMSLIMAVRGQPFSVVLLDEIEKAHPNILNLLLQLLDEGQLTDTGGKTVSFKDCIIIATSNAGATSIRDHIDKGEAIETFQDQFTDELINSGQFKPELLNRFDEIVLFRPLTPAELSQVVALMMNEINQTLSTQNISVQLTPAAVEKIVAAGYDPRLGARPMRRMLQRAVEDVVAQKILRGEAQPGDQVLLDVPDLSLEN